MEVGGLIRCAAVGKWLDGVQVRADKGLGEGAGDQGWAGKSGRQTTWCIFLSLAPMGFCMDAWPRLDILVSGRPGLLTVL